MLQGRSYPRAYSDSSGTPFRLIHDIYIFDNPLQTHNVALASSIADFVVALRDGAVTSQGSLSEALEQDIKLSTEVAKEIEVIKQADEDHDSDNEKKPEQNGGKLIVDEEISEGRVGWSAR